MSGTLLWIALLVVAVLVLLFLALTLQFFNLWLQAALSGARVGYGDLIGMWLRKVNPKIIVHDIGPQKATLSPPK